MELTRTNAVFSRIAMVLFLCRNKCSRNVLKICGDFFWNKRKIPAQRSTGGGGCHAQDATLSSIWHEGLVRDSSASRRVARMDIITSTCTEKMSIRSWLTLATSYIRDTSVQYIQSSGRRAGSIYGRNK